jgi:hypothetical protein
MASEAEIRSAVDTLVRALMGGTIDATQRAINQGMHAAHMDAAEWLVANGHTDLAAAFLKSLPRYGGRASADFKKDMAA